MSKLILTGMPIRKMQAMKVTSVPNVVTSA